MTPERIPVDTAMNAPDTGRIVVASGRYRVTENDSVHAAKLDGRPTRALLVMYAAIALGLFTLCLSGSLKTKMIAGCALLGGVTGEMLTRHVIAPARKRRLYRRNELLQNEFDIGISDRDIRIFSARTDAVLTADRVAKWKEGKGHIVIYVSRRTYFSIPERLAETAFDLDRLRARLRDYAGAPSP